MKDIYYLLNSYEKKTILICVKIENRLFDAECTKETF